MESFKSEKECLEFLQGKWSDDNHERSFEIKDKNVINPIGFIENEGGVIDISFYQKNSEKKFNISMKSIKIHFARINKINENSFSLEQFLNEIEPTEKTPDIPISIYKRID